MSTPAPAGSPISGAPSAGSPSSAPPSTGVAVPAAVGLVVAAVVAAFAIVGLVVSLSTDRLPTGPALAPPLPAAAEVTFDASTREARFAEVRVTMPDQPYECPTSPDAVPPLLDSGIICTADVHADYQGTADWAATAGFGSVPRNLAQPTAEATAKAIFQQLRASAFGSLDTTLSDVATEQADLGGEQVTVVRGHVHYRVAGLPSTYDRVVVVVLPLDDGGYAAYFTSRPDDTPQSALDSLNASLGTLHYGR